MKSISEHEKATADAFADAVGANGEASHAEQAAPFDASAYRTTPQGEAGPDPQAAPEPAVAWGDDELARLAAYLTSAGIPSERVEAFREQHGADLRALYESIGFGDALAEFGLTKYGDGQPMPPWMAALAGVGGTAVLTLMVRPELIGRLRAAFGGRAGEGGPDGSGLWTDDGGGAGGAGAAGEGASNA